jgi:LysM repeat protein
MGINMKDSFIKWVLGAMIFCLGTTWAWAQQFATHKVKSGETLYSIAKEYQVTPYNILQANKELKSAEDLQPNTILVIPLSGAKTTAEEHAKSGKKVEQEKEEEQEKPYAFDQHKVRKRETLFGISKRYGITEDDIKKYNTELYSSQLKKGMKLQIPKYRKPKTKEVAILNDSLFVDYVVKPKETRWSIAHKAKITLDSLLELNPELDVDSSLLTEGQVLKLPRPPGSTVEKQQVQLYQSYTVPPKMTFYSLEKKFGVKAEELMALNPEIQEKGGLKEGMVIRIPEKKPDLGIVNTENFNFYEVKPKQTEFSLTRKFGIGYQELLDLNPDLKKGLKAGMVLKLPKKLPEGVEVKNSLVLDKINLIDSIDVAQKPKLLIMLPFRLDMVSSDTKKTALLLSKRNDMKFAMGMYTGALVAMDSIKKYGVSVEAKAVDTELSLMKTREILLKENLHEYSAVLGAFNEASLREVSEQAARYGIPVVSTLGQKMEKGAENVFYSVPQDSILRHKMIEYVESIYQEENIVVIADSSGTAAKNSVIKNFPTTKILKLKDNISLDIDEFRSKLSEEKDNWVFVETDNYKVVSSVASILNSAHSDSIKVKMFTTDRNKAFEHDVISNAHLSNLKFTFPSYQNESMDPVMGKLYKRKFGTDPDRFAIRGFDLTFDLLLKLAFKKDIFEVSNMIGSTHYTANKFDFVKGQDTGYANDIAYILEYDKMYIKEVKPKLEE